MYPPNTVIATLKQSFMYATCYQVEWYTCRVRVRVRARVRARARVRVRARVRIRVRIGEPSKHIVKLHDVE